jgi:PII-like signaling protein
VRARHPNMAGATVFSGRLGYGRGSGLLMGKILRACRDLPAVIENQGGQEKANAFLDIQDRLPSGGAVTLEKAGPLRFPRKPRAG